MNDTTAAYIAHQYVVDRLDSVEIYDADGLAGYALAEIPFGYKVAPSGAKPLTPTRCCRTCAWADAEHVRYVPGHGLAYQSERQG